MINFAHTFTDSRFFYNQGKYVPSWAWCGSAICIKALSFLLNKIFTLCTSPYTPVNDKGDKCVLTNCCAIQNEWTCMWKRILIKNIIIPHRHKVTQNVNYFLTHNQKKGTRVQKGKIVKNNLGNLTFWLNFLCKPKRERLDRNYFNIKLHIYAGNKMNLVTKIVTFFKSLKAFHLTSFIHYHK